MSNCRDNIRELNDSLLISGWKFDRSSIDVSYYGSSQQADFFIDSKDAATAVVVVRVDLSLGRFCMPALGGHGITIRNPQRLSRLSTWDSEMVKFMQDSSNWIMLGR
jgi:hypothetical protein